MASKTSSKFVQITEERRIFVDHFEGNRPNDPCILYVPGFLSHRNSEKGKLLYEYCYSSGLEYIRYDPEGMGKSSFESMENWSNVEFRHWFEDCEAAMSVSKNKKYILVGSSMGGWISLLTYKKLNTKIVGMILIAPATNFLARKVAESSFNLDSSIASYIDKYQFAKKSEELAYSLEPKVNPIKVPLVILHGMKDDIILPENSLELMHSFEGNDIELTFISDGDHRLNEYFDKIKSNLEVIIKKSKIVKISS